VRKKDKKSARSRVLGCLSVFLAGCFAEPAARPADEPLPELPLIEEMPHASVPGSLRIASIFPTLGRYALSGRQSHNGVRLAVEVLNETGGIHGRPVELLEARTGSSFLDARYAVEELLVADDVLAIVGSNSSSLSLEIAPVAQSRGIVQISNVSTVPDVTLGRDFVFRVCHSDAVLGGLLAEFARYSLSAHRVAILHEAGRPYSANLATSFARNFLDFLPGPTERPSEVRIFLYPEFETDFRRQLLEVQDYRPDVVVVPGSFSDATLVAMQAELMGLEATLLGGDSWSSRLLFARGGPGRTAFHTDHWHPDAPFLSDDGRMFPLIYRERFCEELNGARAPMAYDALLAVATALESLGPLEDTALEPGPEITVTRRRLRDALNVVDFVGVTGRVRFDENGDAVKGCAIIRVERGRDGLVSRFDRWVGER